MLKGMLFVIAITAPAISYGAVYQCKANGQTVFSDSPCGDDAKKLDHKPAPAIGGQFDTGTDVEFYEPPARRVDGRMGRRASGMVWARNLCAGNGARAPFGIAGYLSRLWKCW